MYEYYFSCKPMYQELELKLFQGAKKTPAPGYTKVYENKDRWRVNLSPLCKDAQATGCSRRTSIPAMAQDLPYLVCHNFLSFTEFSDKNMPENNIMLNILN